MIDVNVYKNDSGEKLYHVDGTYLSKNQEELIVEFPELTSNQDFSD